MNEAPRRHSPLERHLTMEEIAASVQVSTRTVLRWIESGRICRARRLGPRLYRVPESAVAAFLDMSTVSRC